MAGINPLNVKWEYKNKMAQNNSDNLFRIKKQMEIYAKINNRELIFN